LIVIAIVYLRWKRCYERRGLLRKTRKRKKRRGSFDNERRTTDRRVAGDGVLVCGMMDLSWRRWVKRMKRRSDDRGKKSMCCRAPWGRVLRGRGEGGW